MLPEELLLRMVMHVHLYKSIRTALLFYLDSEDAKTHKLNNTSIYVAPPELAFSPSIDRVLVRVQDCLASDGNFS